MIWKSISARWFDAFINRIINEGLAAMETDTYAAKGKPPVVTVPASTKKVDYVKANYDYAVQLIDNLNTTITELNALLAEQNTNLALLNRIQARLSAAVRILRQLILKLLRLITPLPKPTPKLPSQSGLGAINNLIPLMDTVITADATGNQAAINAALASFEPAHTNATSILQSLTGSSYTDLYSLSEDVMDYKSSLVAQSNNAITRRGNPFSSDGTSSLYGWWNSLPGWCGC